MEARDDEREAWDGSVPDDGRGPWSEERDDEREALGRILQGIVEEGIDLRDAVDAVLAAGYRKHPEPEITEEMEFAPGECTGASDCDAPIHVHGCYRPHRADQCDAPDEYGHVVPVGEGEQ